MATSLKRRVALKGLSRSKFCGEPIKARSKVLCLRLAGHKKAHRATTMRAASLPAVETVEVTPDYEDAHDDCPLDVPHTHPGDEDFGPDVTVIAAVEAERTIAAPPKRARRAGASAPSGKPSARLA